MSVGNELKSIRKRLSLTTQEAATLIGLQCKSSWKKRECDLIPFTDSDWQLFCNVIGMNYHPDIKITIELNKKFIDKFGYNKSLIDNVKVYINKGHTLTFAAENMDCNYIQLKSRLRWLKFKYPSRDELRDNFCLYRFQMNFKDFIQDCINKSFSNNYIARLLDIDVSNLYKLNSHKELGLKNRVYKLDDQSKRNINNARLRRIRTTSTAFLISKRGQLKTLSEWSKSTGINASTIRRRIVELRWPVNKALEVNPQAYKPSFERSMSPIGIKSQLNKIKKSKPKAEITKGNKQSKIAQSIYDAYIDNNVRTEYEYYMVKIIYSTDIVDADLKEEMSLGSLYLDENGQPCSLDRAAVITCKNVVYAYLQFITLYRKKINWVLDIESFASVNNDIDKLNRTHVWRSKIEEYLSKNNFIKTKIKSAL